MKIKYKWIAVDADGRVWKYTKIPTLNINECDHIWFSAGDMLEIGSINMTGIDWKKTRNKIAQGQR